MLVVITPAGREPGTSRAERGRSRQPLARITASGVEQLAPARAGELERPGGRPARDHRLGAELGARTVGELREPARVGGAGQRPVQVAQPEALVGGVARDATRLALPLDHDDVAHAEPAELARRREARGPAAHDHDAHARSSRSDVSSAPQKKPWQRPMCARVRRRRPSRSTGGIGEAKASRISPRVTRSQKQTMRP